jgi:hypothetical protein
VIINYSRYKLYQTCPRQYYWRYLQNLVLPKVAMPLLFGRCVHKGLEVLLSGKDIEEAKTALLEEWNSGPQVPLLPEEQELVAKHQRYALFVLEKYHATYPTEEWTVLAPEVEGTADLPEGHKLKFRTDGIVSWRNAAWLVEHKTTAALGPTFFNRFRMDGQITAYIYGVNQVLKVQPVGAVINALFKARNLDKTDFQRDIVMRTKSQVEEFVTQLGFTCSFLERTTRNCPDKASWLMHTHSCFNYNRPCDYLELCYHDTPGVRELFVERSSDYVDDEEAS